MKKAIFVVFLFVAVGALGWYVFVRAADRKPEVGPRAGGRGGAVAVEVAQVKKAAIRDVGLFTGTLLARSQFVVAPKIAGRLEKLEVNIGDAVSAGQLIARLDDQEYRQQVEQARAELDVTKANVAECKSALDVGAREFERAKALREQKIASESELDQAEARFKASEAQYKVALAQVEQKDAAMKGAEVRLAYTKIEAAWEDGAGMRVVGERFVDEGAMLRANDPIVSILDVGVLVGVINVIERDYTKVKIGQAVSATTDAFPDKTFTGKVVRVAPLLVETSRQARVEVEIPNPGRLLKPGMFVRAQIEFARHDDATVVPLAALVKREGQQGVFIADAKTSKARFVPVKLGIVDGEQAEVVEPPLEGLVVTLGHHLLQADTTILVSGPGGAARPRAPSGGTTSPARLENPAAKEGPR